MTKLTEIISALNLTPLTSVKSPDTTVKYAYVSDLLSNVMASCPGNCLWITVQCHINVIGVASLLDVQAVVFSGDVKLTAQVLSKAEEVGVTVLQSSDNAFDLCGRLYDLGLKGILRRQF
ncbi:MAG: hypothetical protein FD169_1557 [Bacillota bacterium]|nr:MAG: hypothetical protein FD169_1557 [Bacillota bacterium]MBS3951176.1 hypothetical protein [Peptococcaceae bacterium]